MAGRPQAYPELLDIASEALFAVSLDGVVLSWNRRAEELYGFTAAEAIGQPWISLTVPEHERAATEQQLVDAVANRPVATHTARRSRQGTPLHVALAMHLVTTSGDVRYVAIRERDIPLPSERGGFRSELLANMSHELRTPLNSIIGFAELMHKGKVGVLAPDHVEYLGDIITSARRLLGLVNEVVDLAKLEAGKLSFRSDAIDLEQLVLEVRDALQGPLGEKHHTLALEVDRTCTRVIADAARIRQVIHTFVANALKVTPAGGTVSVRVAPGETDHVRLEVEDQAPGSDRDRALQREGSGLGLALARRIVEAQGGHVEVASRTGGNIYSAVLPRTAVTTAG